MWIAPVGSSKPHREGTSLQRPNWATEQLGQSALLKYEPVQLFLLRVCHSSVFRLLFHKVKLVPHAGLELMASVSQINVFWQLGDEVSVRQLLAAQWLSWALPTANGSSSSSFDIHCTCFQEFPTFFASSRQFQLTCAYWFVLHTIGKQPKICRKLFTRVCVGPHFKPCAQRLVFWTPK